MTLRQFRDALGRATGDGWLTTDEALLLACAANLTAGPLVEVGSYMGRSAMVLAASGRRLYCVDPWADGFSDSLSGQEIYRRFLANIAKVPGADVAPVRCRVEDWPGVPAEFVYLDGDHTYAGTLAQLDAAARCGAKVVAVHDVDERGGGAEVLRACLERLGPTAERTGRLAVWGYT